MKREREEQASTLRGGFRSKEVQARTPLCAYQLYRRRGWHTSGTNTFYHTRSSTLPILAASCSATEPCLLICLPGGAESATTAPGRPWLLPNHSPGHKNALW